ncbi:MAG: MFS transporter [Proteobacteria bacterium]|nr:MFS transporter [Pseudomonadota bacterium]
MTQLTEAPLAPRATTSSPVRLITAVCAAHFVSHYYIIILAPLLPFVRADYGVTYTEIGLAIATFNVVSAALQTPAGFLIDRVGARVSLFWGLLLGGAAFLLAGLVNSFWFLVAMFAVAGIGNTVYHPADYALLSQHVREQRIGQAFSLHTFGGMLGSALAPPTLLMMQAVWGWRGAFIGAGIMGLVIAVLVLMVRDPAPLAPARPQAKDAATGAGGGWTMLMSPAILLNLMFFVLLAVMNSGMNNYSVVALGALFGTPVGVANTALTCLLMLTAIGVLAGGLVVTRTALHATVAGLGLIGMVVTAALVATFDLHTVLLIAVMSAFGFFSGVIAPSRDMIVREATPPGAFGRVFGFVTTGFNLGGIVAPMLFGALMDAGRPRWVFIGVALAALIAVATVTTVPKRPRPQA